MHEIIILYVPFPNRSEAIGMSEKLLKRRFISCSNLSDAQSLYSWNNELNQDFEVIGIFKTLQQHAAEITDYIEEEHSYDTPCVMTQMAGVNSKYFNWMKKQIKE